VGTLQFVGKAKQVFEKGAIILVAKAPTSLKVVPGLLHQKYAAGGRSESGSAVGSQVPLVGEHDASIALHPLVQTFDQPTMALGQPSGGMIPNHELQLKSAPACSVSAVAGLTVANMFHQLTIRFPNPGVAPRTQ
jgi:hypothetical protein